jgi:4'-phosphopantetheinyl transferase
MNVRWHHARGGEVPADDEWLTPNERAVVAGLAVAKRRADWRLGRWTAKALLSAELGVPVDRVEVRAADDGAPEPYVDGGLVGLSLSLSHRDSIAVAAVAPLPTRVGVDLETLETRSDAFVREWLSVDERLALPDAGDARDVAVLRCWTGKEASAKVLREGLRLDVRHAVVVADAASSSWQPMKVTWRTEGITHRGWWRLGDIGVLAVVTDPPVHSRVRLAASCSPHLPSLPPPLRSGARPPGKPVATLVHEVAT